MSSKASNNGLFARRSVSITLALLTLTVLLLSPIHLNNATAASTFFDGFDYESMSDPEFIANWTYVPPSVGSGSQSASIDIMPGGNKVFRSIISNTPGTGLSQVYDAPDFVSSDSVIEFDVGNWTASGGSIYRECDVGLDFRASATAAYRFAFWYTGSYGVTERFLKITGSRNYEEQESVLDATPWRASFFPEYHHVRIECQGQNLTAYLDRSPTPILTVSDPSFSGGCIGTYFMSGDGGSGSITNSAFLDNISVNTYSYGGPPSAPQVPQAVGGNGMVSLTWSAPASDGGSAITSYNIYRGTSTEQEKYLTNVTPSHVSYVDGAVTNGLAYFYWISAVNSYGEGPHSDEVSATPAGEQGDESYVKISSGTGSFAQVSSSNKQISVRPGSNISGSVVLLTYNAWAGSAIIPLIGTPSWGTPNASYWQVAYWIGTGSGTCSAEGIDLTVPSQPGLYYLIFAFRAETDASYVASGTNWATGPPLWDDGNEIANLNSSGIQSAQTYGRAPNLWFLETGYQVLSVPCDAVTVYVTQQDDPADLSGVNITSGTASFASITSTNKKLTVDPGEAVSGSLTLYAVNSWPSDSKVPMVACPTWDAHSSSYQVLSPDVAGGSASLTFSVTVTVPAKAGDYALVIAFKDDISPAHVASATDSSIDAPVWGDGNDVADFTMEQTYSAQSTGRTRMSWLTSNGYMMLSMPSDAIVIQVVSPYAPSTVKDVSARVLMSGTNPSVKLEWSPPENDGGYPLVGYKIYEGDSPNYQNYRATTSPSVLSAKFSDVALGMEYFYAVAAVNPNGEGPKSSVVLAEIPGVPSQVRAVAGIFLQGKILLTWMSPSDDGGSPVLGYMVLRCRFGGTISPVRNLSAGELGYRDTDVKEGEAYQYYICATNAIGNGSLSSMVLVVAGSEEKKAIDTVTLIELTGGIAGILAAAIPLTVYFWKRARGRKAEHSDKDASEVEKQDSEEKTS